MRHNSKDYHYTLHIYATAIAIFMNNIIQKGNINDKIYIYWIFRNLPINHKILLAMLKLFRFNNTHIYISFEVIIYQRKQFIQIDNISSTSGVLQGSIFGPLLFTLYTLHQVGILKFCNYLSLCRVSIPSLVQTQLEGSPLGLRRDAVQISALAQVFF